MTERTAGITVVFALCLTILVAAAMYRGHIVPDRPTTQSSYDQAAYLFEIGLWCVTIASGAFLVRAAWVHSKRFD